MPPEDEYEEEETEDGTGEEVEDAAEGEDEEASEDEESEDEEEEEEEEEEEASEDEAEEEEASEDEGGSGAPPAEAGTTYTVRYGDTLSAIASQAYGNKHGWKGIYAANRDIIGANPNVIKAGQALWIPEEEDGGEEDEAEEEADGEGGSYYTVRPGDSLSAIAQRELGDASRWSEIYELNQDTIGGNPNLIQPGQELELPQ